MPQEFLSAPPPALSWVQQNLLLPLPLRIKVYELWAWAFLREVPQLLAHVAALPLLSSDLFFVDGSSIHWPLGTSILVTLCHPISFWSIFLVTHKVMVELLHQLLLLAPRHFNSCTEKLKEIFKLTLKSGYIYAMYEDLVLSKSLNSSNNCRKNV